MDSKSIIQQALTGPIEVVCSSISEAKRLRWRLAKHKAQHINGKELRIQVSKHVVTIRRNKQTIIQINPL